MGKMAAPQNVLQQSQSNPQAYQQWQQGQNLNPQQAHFSNWINRQPQPQQPAQQNPWKTAFGIK